jgi:sugar diacid utilization regulator
VLEPLEDGPELIATLEGYFAADFDRRKAAGNLHIHPNTLDYRLRRVAELTGLSVGSAKGVQVLGAALTIRRMRVEP